MLDRFPSGEPKDENVRYLKIHDDDQFDATLEPQDVQLVR
jgi:hypothetical protein